MKKYIIEEKSNFGDWLEFGTYEEAISYYSKVLYEESNYNYKINKENIWLLESYECASNEETENWEILKEISIKDFNNLNYEEKEIFIKDTKK